MRQISFSLEDAESGLIDEEDKSSLASTPCNKAYVFKLFLKFFIWSIFFARCVQLEFGLVFFIISLMCLLYYSTSVRKRKGLSAYSVFNPNMEQLRGAWSTTEVKNSLSLGY